MKIKVTRTKISKPIVIIYYPLQTQQSFCFEKYKKYSILCHMHFYNYLLIFITKSTNSITDISNISIVSCLINSKDRTKNTSIIKILVVYLECILVTFVHDWNIPVWLIHLIVKTYSCCTLYQGTKFYLTLV